MFVLFARCALQRRACLAVHASKLDIIETIQRVIKALILTSRLGLDYLFKFTMTSDRCEGVKTQHERADVHQSLHSPHCSKGWPGNKRLTEWWQVRGRGWDAAVSGLRGGGEAFRPAPLSVREHWHRVAVRGAAGTRFDGNWQGSILWYSRHNGLVHRV